MTQEFINAQLPSWAQVVPGQEEIALLATIADVAREDLLDYVLSWINHPEYVTVEVAHDGHSFRLSSRYRRTDYAAVATVEGLGLKYIEPWAEARDPQPPLYGVKMTLPNNGGMVEVLLTERPKDNPEEYDIFAWGRGGTMYDGAVFENIPGEITWNEGETQAEFHERAHAELLARIDT